MPLRDEVNEPLGLWPDPQPGPAGRVALTMISLAAPVVVAIAMAAFTLGRQEAAPRVAQLAMEAHAPVAPTRAEPPPAARPAVQPVAAAEDAEAASAVKVTRYGAGASTPLIIDVQQALAARKARADPFVLR